LKTEPLSGCFRVGSGDLRDEALRELDFEGSHLLHVQYTSGLFYEDNSNPETSLVNDGVYVTIEFIDVAGVAGERIVFRCVNCRSLRWGGAGNAEFHLEREEQGLRLRWTDLGTGREILAVTCSGCVVYCDGDPPPFERCESFPIPS
jgi:hypothetical protein